MKHEMNGVSGHLCAHIYRLMRRSISKMKHEMNGVLGHLCAHVSRLMILKGCEIHRVRVNNNKNHEK